MNSGRLPVLAEGGSNLDWANARYTVNVTIRSSQAIVVHRMDDAPSLDRLIESGQVQWITEFRCPRTMFSREKRSSDSTQKVSWKDWEVVGETFLLPGLVAVGSVEFDPVDLNPFVWPTDTPVEVPAGWWLARGEARRVTPLVSSLVKFREDSRLDPGQMSVHEDNDGGTPCFVVGMAPDLYASRRHTREVQIAGLIAACGKLPLSSLRQGEENEEHALAQLLRLRFEEAKVEDWDSEEFDPAKAATCLEPFHVTEIEEDQ